MSGVNAAATLTLEVNTASAEEKLNALEQRINKLDGTHQIKLDITGGTAQPGLDQVKNSLASIAASIEDLNNRSVRGMKGVATSAEALAENNRKIMLRSAEMTGNAIVKSYNDSVKAAERALKDLSIAKNQANNLELRVIAAEEAGKVREAARLVKELNQAKNQANNLELRVIAAEEAGKVREAARLVKELNQAKNQANNLELRLIAREEADRLRAAKKDAEEIAKWLALTEKQRASATLQAAKAHYGGANQSLLPGVAGSNVALVSAQQLGSVHAAQQALDNLAVSHNRVSGASGSLSEKLKEQSKHMWDLHSAARGLTGGLGALWLTYGSTIPLMTGAALSGGFITAMKAGSEFAYQLTFVKALGGETAESIAGIGKAALSLSKNSMYGPVELANGLRILSQAGLSASDSLLALPQAMSLATVGEMNMEQAAITLTGVMNAFNLGVGDMAHIGDVFAKAAALSQTSVQDMTEAMKTASVVGEQYGASMEDTATALTLLAKVNISGTAAGTALRNMLKELYTPTAGAAKVIKQLGLETKDAMGNMKSFPEIIYQLKGILAGYDKASQVNILQALFGERGAKEAIAMLGKTRDQWDDLNKSISESDGFMRKVSAELESTASGMFKQAFNTMQANLVGAFDKSEGAAKQLAVALRNLADSAQFKEAINGIVEGVSKLATVLVEATPTLIRFGEAWLIWKSVGVLVGGVNMAVGAIRGLATAMTIVSAEAALAGGGLAGLRAGLIAAGGAAGVAAGATGVGLLSRALSVLTSPITAVVVALGGLAYAVNEYILKMPAAVDAANTFVDSLDRESKKLREEIELLEKKNRLQLSGKSVDTNAAEQELANIVKNRDDAIARKNNENLSPRELFQAELEYSAFVEAEMKARGKLRDLENDQVRYDAANLVAVLQSGRERLKDIQLDADAAKKKVDTSSVEALLNAYEGKKLSGSDIRAVQKELDRRLSKASQDILGSGAGKWEAPGKPDRSAQKDARTIFDDNLNTAIAKDKLETDLKTLEIDRKLADQTIDSISAIREKAQAQKEGLEAQKATLESALRSIDVTKEQQALLQAAKDEGSGQFEAKVKELGLDDKKVQITKVLNDLSQLSVERQKQGAQSTVTLTAALRNQANAIEDISRSSARYSEDLKDEISYLGKTTLEVQQLRIEKQRLRDVQDIDTKLKRNAISGPEAEALKDQANAKAKLDDAEAQRQLSFVGGWQKAYDENLKNITDMSKRAGDIFNKMSDSMADSLTEFVMTGKMSFGDLVSSMIKDMVRMQMKAMTTNLFGLLGNALGFNSTPSPTGLASLPSSVNTSFNANGNVYSSPSLHAYANQIHDTPKFFAFAQGAGVFGEAGPEAIMPLKHGPDGKLGVQAASSGMSIVINNNGTPQTVTSQREVVDSRGRRSMVLEMSDAMAAEAQRSGSRLNRAVRSPQMIVR